MIELCILCFLVCFIFNILLLKTVDLHGKFTFDSIDGIQKIHNESTPRVGGLSIVAAILILIVLSNKEVKQILTIIFCVSLPSFVVGFIEDLTKKVGVIPRLVTTFSAGIILFLAFNYSITYVATIGLDQLLKIQFISVMFTAFALAGIANAVNIIDGFNGLASSMAIYAFVGLSVIAYIVEDTAMVNVTILLSFIILGFFIFNWPFGKIFLGDGGAYFIGIALGTVSVLLLERNKVISPYSILLIFTHPISEVLFSIYRRIIKRTSPGGADRLHFHSLLNKRIVLKIFKGESQVRQNSITGISVGFLTLNATIIATLTYDSVLYSKIAFFTLSAMYIYLYIKIINFNLIKRKRIRNF